MKKAIYKPSNERVMVIDEKEKYCEIFLNGEERIVPREDLEFEGDKKKLSSLDKLKENVYIECVKNPLLEILYSQNTNRLVPEAHQYKPLIKFLNSENNRILIADEVGLGKTIEAGMIYKEVQQREELAISLIVVPSSLTLKWKSEMELRFEEYFEIKKTKEFLNFLDEYDSYSGKKHFNKKLIISYHTLRDERVIEKLEEIDPTIDFLVMDEAHSMRNFGTSTFDGGKLITGLSRNIIFLTATPVQNSLEDLFNVLRLLDENYFSDFEYFKKMIQPNKDIHQLISLLRNNASYSQIQSYINLIDINEYSDSLKEIILQLKEEELSKVKRLKYIDDLIKEDSLSFIINRTKKKDVGKIIPRNVKSSIVEINNEERDYYNSVIEFIKFINPSTPQGFITIMPERMASSSMVASLESFKEMKKNKKFFLNIEGEEIGECNLQGIALEYLDEIIDKGIKIGERDSKLSKLLEIVKNLNSENIDQMIIFSFFKKTLNYLEKVLKELGYRVGKIHGDFSTEERFNIINEFRQGKFDILLSSEVGSEGLDMQFCNVVINYDLPWNPMRVEQRIGRIDRIGQKFDKLHIFNLCIEGSIEDRIYNRLYTKLNIFESSIGELEPILGELQREINIPEIIKLNQDEIDKKIHLEELASKRKELEKFSQNGEIEKLLNDDWSSIKERFLDKSKEKTLQDQTKKLIVNFFDENKVLYSRLKNGNIKVSPENKNRLFKLLKNNMSNKKEKTFEYERERELLKKIRSSKELKIEFYSSKDKDFNTLHIHLYSTLVAMIIRGFKVEELHTRARHKDYKNSYATIFRGDLNSTKSKSFLRVIILDDTFSYVEEVDYFNFLEKIEKSSLGGNNLKNLKKAFQEHIFKRIEELKEIEKKEIDLRTKIKIDSVSSYFDKSIKRVEKLKREVKQENVQRMRLGELDNLKEQKEQKIKELKEKSEITSQYKVLGIMELV